MGGGQRLLAGNRPRGLQGRAAGWVKAELAPAVRGRGSRHEDVEGVATTVGAELGQQVVDDAVDVAAAIGFGKRQQLGIQGNVHCWRQPFESIRSTEMAPAHRLDCYAAGVVRSVVGATLPGW